MRVTRASYSRRKGLNTQGCGCGMGIFLALFVVGVVLVLFLPAVPALGLRIAGFEPVAETEKVFETGDVDTVIPLVDATAGSQFAVSYAGERRIVSGVPITIGTSEAGQAQVQVTFNESNIISLCNQYSAFCTSSGSRVRNVRVDFRSGGAILQADVYITQLASWQSVNAVVTISDDNQLVVEGVDVGGVLYEFPDGELGELVRDIEWQANDFLHGATVEVNGEIYRLSSVVIDDDSLVLVLR